jgi:hypothetical protein
MDTSIALTVCSFLDPRSLSAVEVAGLDRHCIAACWAALLSTAEEQLADRPLWRPESKPEFATDPKEALRELALWLRNLAAVPKPWGACIRKLSDTKVEIHPRHPGVGAAIASGAHHGGSQDSVGFELERPRLEPPSLAGVPLAVGCISGEPMAVGIQLTSEKLSKVGEAFLLGIELVSVDDGQGVFTPVYFSPVSGRVLCRFPGEHEGLVAQAMPPLSGAPNEADLEVVEAFALVGVSGYISFGRRRGPRDSIEWSGELRSDCLPPSTVECFPSLTFQIDKLEVPAQISITWAGDLPPASVEPDRDSLHHFCAVWSVHEW